MGENNCEFKTVQGDCIEELCNGKGENQSKEIKKIFEETKEVSSAVRRDCAILCKENKCPLRDNL